MYCPRDGKCPFDGFKMAGVHVCAMPRCQYPNELKRALQNRIDNILKEPQGRTRREKELGILIEQVREIDYNDTTVL